MQRRHYRQVLDIGRHWDGKPIARGALYLLLQNRIYRGETVHKDRHYPGEHEAIVDPGLWDTAQAKLVANAVERSTGAHSRNPSLLAGLLYDADGNRMTPTDAVKKGPHHCGGRSPRRQRSPADYVASHRLVSACG